MSKTCTIPSAKPQFDENIEFIHYHLQVDNRFVLIKVITHCIHLISSKQIKSDDEIFMTITSLKATNILTIY